MIAAASGGDPVHFALTLDRAAKELGIDFLGGYSALVQKGFAAGDERLIRSIPEALSRTELSAQASMLAQRRLALIWMPLP
jgi:uncharacterized protein (UPF0210 family)